MNKAIRYMAQVAITLALTLPLWSAANAQTSSQQTRMPPSMGAESRTVPSGMAPRNDTQRPANGQHGNNNSNGG